MKNVSDMNGNEKIAYNNILNGFNWEVGGWYNFIQDDDQEGLDALPNNVEKAKDWIYESVMNNKYDIGYCGYDKAPKEMRFAGEQFIREVIDHLFATDGDIQELAEVKHWKI